MTIQPTIPVQNKLNLSPENARLYEEFFKTPNNAGYTVLNPAIPTSSINNAFILDSEEKKSPDKFYKFAFLTGIAAAALQVTSGLAFIALAKLGGGKKLENANQYTGKAKTAAKIAFSTLGLSYLICAPSTAGAGINAQQPGIVLHSLVAAALGIVSMVKSVNTRVKGLLTLAYAPLFAGFANKINNEFNSSNGKNSRKMNVDFVADPDYYINFFSSGRKGQDARQKLVDFIKFSFIDMKDGFISSGNAAKELVVQSKNYITGERKERPDIFTIKPTKESMSIASTMAILGSVPKVIMGNKMGNKTGRIADFLIGAGFLFDSLGMMSIAHANDDGRKLPMEIGGPMRVIGDFRQENNFFYGLRTIGGAAFEYYYALMNKEKDGKLVN